MVTTAAYIITMVAAIQLVAPALRPLLNEDSLSDLSTARQPKPTTHADAVVITAVADI